MSASPAPPRGEETRRRLLAAAERVFADHGYHEASVSRITDRAGVGQGTFYLYFDDEAGHLQRTRRGPEPPRAPGDERGRARRVQPTRSRASGLRRLLPLHRRASRALPGGPRGRARLARRPATALLAHRRGLHRRTPGRGRRRRDRRHRPDRRRMGAHGHRRDDRHALGALGRPGCRARRRRRPHRERHP